MSNYKQVMAQEIAQLAIKAGFRAFIAKPGGYGYFTDGKHVVSFSTSLCTTSYSGNYSSDSSGSGWEMDATQSYEDMMKQHPPSWITRNDSSVRWRTLESFLAAYQKSSKYAEVFEGLPFTGSEPGVGSFVVRDCGDDWAIVVMTHEGQRIERYCSTLQAVPNRGMDRACDILRELGFTIAGDSP